MPRALPGRFSWADLIIENCMIGGAYRRATHLLLATWDRWIEIHANTIAAHSSLHLEQHFSTRLHAGMTTPRQVWSRCIKRQKNDR